MEFRPSAQGFMPSDRLQAQRAARHSDQPNLILCSAAGNRNLAGTRQTKNQLVTRKFVALRMKRGLRVLAGGCGRKKADWLPSKGVRE
jgi:hypothetical protein